MGGKKKKLSIFQIRTRGGGGEKPTDGGKKKKGGSIRVTVTTDRTEGDPETQARKRGGGRLSVTNETGPFQCQLAGRRERKKMRWRPRINWERKIGASKEGGCMPGKGVF